MIQLCVIPVQCVPDVREQRKRTVIRAYQETTVTSLPRVRLRPTVGVGTVCRGETVFVNLLQFDLTGTQTHQWRLMLR